MKMLKIVVGLVVLLSLTGCSKVPAGNVGIIVHLLGGSKGVDSEEVGVGRYWLGLNDELYLFPTYTQNDTWKDNSANARKDESITFQTKEGLNVNADIGISYHIDPKLVSTVFQKYRKGIEEISDIYLRNMVQDAIVKAASTKDVETIYGQGKSELITSVESYVRKEVEPIGIVIEHVYWVGNLRLPPSVVEAINAKIGATQKTAQRENEIQQSKAEAQKQIEAARGEAESKLAVAKAEAEAVKIRGEAEASAIEAKSKALNTNPQLVQYEIARNWNGQLPTTTMGAASIPMLNLK
jgi:regulator of protease activity HflC (stomatin/prohibitin superfamily)